MKNKMFLSDLILLSATIAAIFIFIALDPSGKLFENILSTASYLLIGLLILVGIGISFVVGGIFWKSRSDIKRPNFFEEMQSTLGNILVPLGFYETKGPPDRMRSIEYTKGNLLVKLDLDIMDSLYYLSAKSRNEKGSYF